MMDEKEQDRTRRKNGARSKTAKRANVKQPRPKRPALSKLDNEKSRLDARICKLIDQGYSPASIAKRLGITQRRIETAVQAGRRSH